MNDFLYRVYKGLIPSVRSLPLIGAIALPVLLGTPSTLKAAPVTFGFETEIDFVASDPEASSIPSIPVGTGDTLSVSFSFDPDVPITTSSNPSATVYMAEFQIKLKDIEITTNSFSVEVFDDSLTIGTFSSPDAPPVFENFDGIRLGCSPSLPAGCQPEITDVPGVGLFSVSVSMNLLGDLSVLDSTRAPSSVGVWNDLDSIRSISLAFDPVELSVATVFYGATVGSLVLVPEPSALSMATIIILFGSLVLRSRFTRLTW